MHIALGAPTILLSRSRAPFVSSRKPKAFTRGSTTVGPLKVHSKLHSLYAPLEDDRVLRRKTGHYAVEIFWDLDNMYWATTRSGRTEQAAPGMSAELARQVQNELVITSMVKRFVDIGTTLANQDLASVVLRVYGNSKTFGKAARTGSTRMLEKCGAQ
eukprot:CAMPEP_0118942936 /NCGR_PEP_ID=MMETSP1169-20130426/37194_1 /TAXON_ID=36882 /ORGANISM="Pyramimonas obovata, Strain CCMP722" /LENGTH=157 /DNA_ID=CAMNT_0006888057 /DNA_START=68 /DNA_END=538 /DNA_ORIENTATION=+